MTKIMLVEDDKSLREIYGVRLLAEGYDIVSAGDGEEALAMAIKERPKLIITDVMMPKISGFDMLDILRSTTETREIKVIMMTALSSDDQRMRGEQMGADRYLVKSQVGIEDVVRVVHEVLGDAVAKPAGPPATAAPAAAFPTPAAPVAPSIAPAAPPRAPVPPASATVAPGAPRFPQAPAAPQHPQAPAPPAGRPMPPVSSTTATPPSAKQRIIQPIGNPQPQVDINALLDRELARESGNADGPAPQVATTAQEKATVQNQINAFGGQAANTPVAPATPVAPQQPAAPAVPSAPATPQAPAQPNVPQPQRPAVQVPDRPDAPAAPNPPVPPAQ
jgi:CheY-like chemotaxis protein